MAQKKRKELPGSGPERPPATAWRGRLTAAALIAAAAFAVYLPALNGGFLLDDDILLTANPLVRASDGLSRIWFSTEPLDYWPVFNSVFWVQWRLWGMRSTGYHVANLILHVGAAWLLWAVLRKLFVPGAFLAALLFAVHPVNVESVAWISQCKSVLALFFFLLSIWSYLRDEEAAPEDTGGRWYAASLAAFGLAMLSKGSVAILPLVLAGAVAWSRPLTRRDLRRLAPFFVIAAGLTLVNVWFQRHGTHTQFRTATPVERLLGAAAAVWFYLYKALLPVDLNFIYPQWQVRANEATWWLPLFAAAATTAALWRFGGRRGRPLLFAWGYFCVALLPVLGFTDVAFMEHSLVADHYQHAALIAVVAVVAAGWDAWRQATAGRLPMAAAAVLVGGLGLLTWRQSALYADATTLYQATLSKNPDSWLAHGNLCGVLAEARRLPEAIEHCEHAVRLHADFPDAHNNLCSTLRDSGRLPEAIEHCEAALRLRPRFPQARNNLANALRESGRRDEAIAQYEEALRLRPDYAEAHGNLGATLAQAGRLAEGIAHLRQAVNLNPDFADARYNLNLALKLQAQAAENGK